MSTESHDLPWILDSGGLSRLAARTKTSVSLIRALTALESWPPLVPTMVLVESLHDDAGREANTHRFLKRASSSRPSA